VHPCLLGTRNLPLSFRNIIFVLVLLRSHEQHNSADRAFLYRPASLRQALRNRVRGLSSLGSFPHQSESRKEYDLLTALIALKSAKDDDAATEQAIGLLHGPSQRESIVDEVRKAWEDGTLESLLDSGMWQSTKCCFVPHSCTARTYFPSRSQTYPFVLRGQT
jgi:hypothetical protein